MKGYNKLTKNQRVCNRQARSTQIWCYGVRMKIQTMAPINKIYLAQVTWDITYHYQTTVIPHEHLPIPHYASRPVNQIENLGDPPHPHWKRCLVLLESTPTHIWHTKRPIKISLIVLTMIDTTWTKDNEGCYIVLSSWYYFSPTREEGETHPMIGFMWVKGSYVNSAPFTLTS